MAYTPSARKSAVEPNTFGNLRTDGSRNAMTGALGNVIQTQDATATPVTSPATVNTTQTLTVPNGATQLTVSPVTNAVQVSEDSTQGSYFAVPAGSVVTFDVADQQYVYLKTGSSTVVSFYFTIV